VYCQLFFCPEGSVEVAIRVIVEIPRIGQINTINFTVLTFSIDEVQIVIAETVPTLIVTALS
jgi:hypothetical protein